MVLVFTLAFINPSTSSYIPLSFFGTTCTQLALPLPVDWLLYDMLLAMFCYMVQEFLLHQLVPVGLYCRYLKIYYLLHIICFICFLEQQNKGAAYEVS